MSSPLTEALADLPDEVAAALALPADQSLSALHTVLRARVVEPLVRAAAHRGDAPADDLAAVAAAVRTLVPEDAENSLGPRVGILVRLLRAEALAAAWMLARDNASGVVRPERATSTWAGGSYLTSELALPTRVDADGRVFAWLPGFRDPRWSLPDDIYDITRFVVMRGALDRAFIAADGVLVLKGSVFLGQLRTEPDDEIVVRLTGPDGARRTEQAVRLRRPDLVKPRGPELRRLAWAGWRAGIDLAALPAEGLWRLRLGIAQGGVRRQEPLGRRRGPLADAQFMTSTHETRSRRYRLDTDERTGGLVVRVSPVTGPGRYLPATARVEARRLRTRISR